MRVVIADDAVSFREGVANLLRGDRVNIVGQARDAIDLMPLVRDKQPDVVIVDIRMPPTHTREGLDAAKAIRAEHPDVGVLVLSQFVEAHYALQLLDDAAQGAGYLLKDRVGNVDEPAAAVRQIAGGGLVIDPTVVAQLDRSRRHNPLDNLTNREREVLGLMAEGRSNQAIARALFVTDKTVEAHVRSIFTKLNLPAAADDHRRVLAVITYLSQPRSVTEDEISDERAAFVNPAAHLAWTVAKRCASNGGCRPGPDTQVLVDRSVQRLEGNHRRALRRLGRLP